MRSILFIAANLFRIGYNLPEKLDQKVGLSKAINVVYERSMVARLENFAKLPLHPNSANSLYKKAEAIWQTSSDERTSARAFDVMSTLVRNQVAVLDMT